ncbi:MAG: S8 family serine peptidase [Candidatus Hodarchaeota archaeon]
MKGFLSTNASKTQMDTKEKNENTNFFIIHELETVPIAVLENNWEKMEEENAGKFLDAAKQVLTWEEEIQFKLSMSSIRNVMDVDFVDTSIYGPFTGFGISIAVIDGGINDEHPDLEKKLWDCRKFLEDSELDLGHGTAVAGIICGNGSSSDDEYIGLAPDVDIVDCIAFNKDGVGKLGDILMAIDWAVQNRVKILCMAFNSMPGSKHSEIFENLLKHVNENYGVIACAGTGNFGPASSTIGMPGIFESVLTTGALTKLFKVQMKSGRGTVSSGKPEFCLPGENIISLNVFNSYFKERHLDKNEFYAVYSGSSVSVAILSGIIAKILQARPSIPYNEMKKVLLDSCNEIEGSAPESSGHGILIPRVIFTNLKRMISFRKPYSQVMKDSLFITVILFYLLVVAAIVFTALF